MDEPNIIQQNVNQAPHQNINQNHMQPQPHQPQQINHNVQLLFGAVDLVEVPQQPVAVPQNPPPLNHPPPQHFRSPQSVLP